MKFKAIITSLVLSTSSIALADDLSFGAKLDGNYDASVHDHRDDMRRPAWMPLSQMLTASRRNVIRIDERQDELRALRLQTGSGATYVYSITLHYEDGHRENITVGKWLYAGAPVLTFELAKNHELDRVVINTWTSRRSTYQVLGQRVRKLAPPPLPRYGFVVGKDLSFANTAGYVQLAVGADKGRFNKVRIESTSANTFIGHVHVTFATGQHQMLPVNKPLYRGETIDLELTGKGAQQITSITVMAGDDVRQVGPSASRFSVTLL
jgi:hypothetical protein